MVNNVLLIATLMLNYFGTNPEKTLPTVTDVDLSRYAGQWYEIARLPNSFEKELNCVTATYTLLDNGKVEVINAGVKGSVDKSIKGKAWVPNPQFPGRLKVRFFWPFAGDYYIIQLADNYRYALVGSPSRKFLWILSKDKSMNSQDYEMLVKKAASLDFEVEKLIITEQNCIN